MRIPLVLLLLAAPLAAGEEWSELFDGRTLDGWVTKGGRYDGNARWTVEDGAIVGLDLDALVHAHKTAAAEIQASR